MNPISETIFVASTALLLLRQGYNKLQYFHRERIETLKAKLEASQGKKLIEFF